jgi:hypothetical protein
MIEAEACFTLRADHRPCPMIWLDCGEKIRKHLVSKQDFAEFSPKERKL